MGVAVGVAVAVEVAWVRASASVLLSASVLQSASVSFLVLPWLLALTWGWPCLLLRAWAFGQVRAWFQARALDRESAASDDGWARLPAMRRRIRMGWVRVPRGDRPGLRL